MPRASSPSTQVELGDGAGVGLAVGVGVGPGVGLEDGGADALEAGAGVEGPGAAVDVGGRGADERDGRGPGLADGARAAADGVFRASASTGPADCDGRPGEGRTTGAGWARDGSPADGPAMGRPAGGVPPCRPSISFTPNTAPTAIRAASVDEAVPYCQRRISGRLLRGG